MTEAEAIAKRIESFGAGRAFTAADFSDVAGRRNAANALGRLHAKGGIARAIRGVYYVPERSALMGTEVPASADEVVRAVARANKWIVAPSGDAALNALGLDTQVPAKLVYVSSGPYKRYEYGPYDIELRHRANRDLLDCSQITCTIVQPWAHMPALDTAAVEALAVFVIVGSFLAYMLYMQGVKDIGSVRASLIGTVEPVSATITSAVMLGTVFLPTDLIGFAMIIVMMFLTV